MSEHRQNRLLRRNGKPQSCEPCRKTKVKCDHGLPICGRCIQRKIQHRCEYHPAPMTQQSSINTLEPHVQQIRTISSIGSEPSEWIGPHLHTHLPMPGVERAAGDQPAGYLGPTSFSAIFRENKLGSTHDVSGQQTTDAIDQEYDVAEFAPFVPCNLEAQEHIDQGVRVLQRFPNEFLCEKLIARYFEFCDVMLPEQVVYHVHRTTWSTFGKYLKEPRDTNTDSLSAMSRELCKTAMKPLVSSASTQDWTESFSGHNLRWEIIGNLFTIFGLSAMTISDWDPLFANANDGNSYDKRQYGGAMQECAEACLSLCNDVDSINDFVVCLMSRIYILQSLYEGDTSESTSRGNYNNMDTAFQESADSQKVLSSGEDMVVSPGTKDAGLSIVQLIINNPVLQRRSACTGKSTWRTPQPQACRPPLWCQNFAGASFVSFSLATNNLRRLWVGHLR